jgi:hypothetical protein
MKMSMRGALKANYGKYTIQVLETGGGCGLKSSYYDNSCTARISAPGKTTCDITVIYSKRFDQRIEDFGELLDSARGLNEKELKKVAWLAWKGVVAANADYQKHKKAFTNTPDDEPFFIEYYQGKKTAKVYFNYVDQPNRNVTLKVAT